MEAGARDTYVKPYVLVLGTADWNQPIATNQHYVARELCRDDYAHVTFVESMALRRPRINKRDMVRIGRRLKNTVHRRVSSPSSTWREQPAGLDVRSPLIVPVHRGLLSLANGSLLNRKVKDWISYEGPKMLWSYTPVTYGLERYADSVVYHCVDLLGTINGISPRVVDDGEQYLARLGASAIATSQVVKDHLEDQGFGEVKLWENVADVGMITAADPLTSLRIPGRVIFAGNLSPNKIDYRILEALADAGLDVCIAGPRTEGGVDGSQEFASLLTHGVQYLGMLTLNELARELTKASMGIIPYALNDYTRGVSPLKTFEYLAAGLPVISTEIPGTPRGIEGIWIEPNLETFVARATSLGEPPNQSIIQSRMDIADSHSWLVRGRQVRDLLTVALGMGNRNS